MDKNFNIPFIILRHMISACSSKVASLPYANLIHKIILANGIEIPDDQPMIDPIHLANHLTKVGWVRRTQDSGLRHFVPDDREINDWIFAPNAAPNQYWNPQEPQPFQQGGQQDQVPPVNPQPYVYPPFALPHGPQAQLEFLCREMYAQRLDMNQVRAGVEQNTKDIGLLRESQASLTKRFIDHYGTSTSQSMPQGFNDQGGNQGFYNPTNEDDFFANSEEDEGIENVDATNTVDADDMDDE